MLMLTRYVKEEIIIKTSDGDIRIVLDSIRSSKQVKIGVDAPQSVKIHRKELLERMEK